MNERSLTRRLATSIVETLKMQGHILLVKGGSEALVRELDALMAPHVGAIAPLLSPRALLVDEVTTTFGTEAVDETVEEMVGKLTQTLMDSDHVEDVFAEDHVIRRDIFRVVRDALLGASGEEDVEEDEGAAVSVRLETLGYVAKAVAKRADVETLRDALERAAEAAGAELGGYDANAREATFALQNGGPDRRLEVEEAVADELADLVDIGLVELPTIERRFELPREVVQPERLALRPRLDVVAAKTLMRSGCAAAWEFVAPDAIKVTFTPMSDKDARDVDEYVKAFSRDAVAIISEPKPPSAPSRALGAPASERMGQPAPSASGGGPPTVGVRATEAEPTAPAAAEKTARSVRDRTKTTAGVRSARKAAAAGAAKEATAAPVAAPAKKAAAAKRTTKAAAKPAAAAKARKSPDTKKTTK